MAVYFKMSSELTSVNAFQEALDCFCYSIPNTSKRIFIAEAIAAKLNIIKAKVSNMSKSLIL